MRYGVPIIFFFGLLALSHVAFAKEEAQTIQVAGFLYEYDEVVSADTDKDGTNDRNTYYKGGKLLLSAYDENGDGADDLWFEWNDDQVVLEMRARNGGEPDEFIVIDEQEKALSIEIPKTRSFFLGGWKWLALFAVLVGIWWYKKKRKVTLVPDVSR